jgi:ribonuclease HII
MTRVDPLSSAPGADPAPRPPHPDAPDAGPYPPGESPRPPDALYAEPVPPDAPYAQAGPPDAPYAQARPPDAPYAVPNAPSAPHDFGAPYAPSAPDVPGNPDATRDPGATGALDIPDATGTPANRNGVPDTRAGRLAAQVLRPLGYTPRRGAGLAGYERVLNRAGLGPVAGVDEAGRGACAGPLVVAAVVLPPSDKVRVAQLADSKALTQPIREQVYEEVVARAVAWHVVVIPPSDIDRLGLHVCNVAGMRRALAGISCRFGYVLTDGFPVSGLPVPTLAMWKGDQVAACVAAASVVAKVTRDRIMTGLHDSYPAYDFAEHKGYVTPRHARALTDFGPCPQHRFSYVNVLGAMRARGENPANELSAWTRRISAGMMPDNREMADVARTAPAPPISAATGNGAEGGAGGTARMPWVEDGSGAS